MALDAAKVRSMDVFSNVLEGTRQYFMGLPKQAQSEGGGPTKWQNEPQPQLDAHPTTPSPASRPPSVLPVPAAPPRPPSEPLEPEPHIIHKATVMREAAEKRREQPEPDDDEEPPAAISPPSHIIRKPPPAPAPAPTLAVAPAAASPAPAPAAPSPSPARPPSAAPSPAMHAAPPSAPVPPYGPAELTSHSPLDAAQYRPTLHRGHTPVRSLDPFAPGRPPDPYQASRPPETYARYPYESNLPDSGRSVHGPPTPSPPRHGSPQTYARLSSTMPQHVPRMREPPVPTGSSQRYAPAPAQPAPLPNDRVPPIHHPSIPSPQQRLPTDTRAVQYPPLSQRREPSPYNRAVQYDRHPQLPSRKYDPQQAYPGYRPGPPVTQTVPTHPPGPYKHVPVEAAGIPYPTRPLERTPAPLQPYSLDSRLTHEASRRAEYPCIRPVETRPAQYHYSAASSSSSTRYAPAVNTVQSSSTPSRSVHRPVAAPKSNYDLPPSNPVQTSPARSNVKPGYPNQQARMTVTVTSLVNQMNQTKQKRESPLDLSVKTVKNSADSSTTQDDVVDSATTESKIIPLQPRPTSSSRRGTANTSFGESHKVDFAPDFSQYRDRSASYSYSAPRPLDQPSNHSVRYNGTYEAPRSVAESFPVEPRQHVYPDRNKYNVPPTRTDYVPRIDLTRPANDERRPDNRIRDDRHFVIEERKRPSGPIVSNIPEKIVRYETWVADSRIDHMSLSAREQHELMSRPVYSYSSHKQFEAYQNEQKRVASSSSHREHYTHLKHRYPYPVEPPTRDRADYNAHYHDRNPSSNSRHVIQKIPSHKDAHHHHLDLQSAMPDKRVLSILRNSLETKQSGLVEPPRPARQIRDVIVIDDVDDSVIEITDLTKEDTEMTTKGVPKLGHSQNVPNVGHHIQMPKAIDSLPRDSEYQRYENTEPKNSLENDVASRIRTKGELKVLPSDNIMKTDLKQDEPEKGKILPKSQKQHLFNQIREDLRLESVIKGDKPEAIIPEVKSEPMNIEEIEKDAAVPIKIENILNNLESPNITSPSPALEDDLDWASACDNFMEQLKSGCHKKRNHRKRIDTSENNNDAKNSKAPKVDTTEASPTLQTVNQPLTVIGNATLDPAIVVKQEPVDEDEIKDSDEKFVNESCNNEIVKPSGALDSMQITIKTEKTSTIDTSIEKDETTKLSVESLQKDKDKTRGKKSSILREDKKLSDEKKVTPNKTKKTLQDENGKHIDKSKPKKKLLFEEDKKVIQTDKPKLKKKLISEGAKENPPEKPTLKEKTFLEGEKEKQTDQPNLQKKSLSEDKLKDQVKNKKTSSSDEDKINTENENKKGKIKKSLPQESPVKEDGGKRDNKGKVIGKSEKNKMLKKNCKTTDSPTKNKISGKFKSRLDKNEETTVIVKKETLEEPIKTVIKEELESTDDDEPLIKSKLQKEKELKYQLLKDLSEKSAYVKLECFDVDLNKNTRISIDSLTKDKDDKHNKGKLTRQSQRCKGKPISIDNNKNENQDEESSSNSDDENLAVTTRLRVRKSIKTEESKVAPVNKTPVKTSSKKQENSIINTSTPLRKPGFGDGSDFHPGWEEELYRYKRSLRMPPRLIAIPRGRSGGPFVRGHGTFFTRGSTSLPDLDPAPLSPAPSLTPSAATDDLCARRPDKLNLDSDLESNSSWSAVNRLHYDSEASTSTVFSSTKAKKKGSIVDVLMQKCGKANESNKRKNKEKDEKTPKLIPKSGNANELLPTPSLGLVKNLNKGSLSAKKEKLMEDIFYLGPFRKETVAAFRNDFIKNTEGLLGATEEFSPVILKSRTRTESRVLKKRATIKEVFGDERPASAPPTSCREEDEVTSAVEEEPKVTVKKEPESKPKIKPKPIVKDKLKRRSSSIRDGLRSTKSLKRNDAKGRLMRLKKRNSLMKSLANKRLKDLNNKIKKEKTDDAVEDNEKRKEEGSSPSTVEGSTKRRLKRLFGRRKYSSGFDYIRKKKKIIRREDTPNNKIRRPGPKPSPESVHDIQKEIKSWFINKSIGETHLHRAARLGYTVSINLTYTFMILYITVKTIILTIILFFQDCVAYCLEKMEAEPSAKDNAGFTPLHVAAAKGHVRIGRLLLQYGSNVSAAAQGGIR